MLSISQARSGSRLYANAFYLWLAFIAPSGLGVVFWALAARLYSAEAVGVGAAAFSALVILSEMAHLGLGFGFLRWLPDLDNKAAGHLLNAIFSLATLTSLAVFSLFLLGLDLFAPSLRILREEPAYLLFFLALAPWAVLYPLLGHAFVAFRDARHTLLQNLAATAARIVLVVALASYLPTFGVVAAAGAGIVAGVGLGFAHSLRRLLPGYWPRPSLAFRPLGQLLPYSLGNYLSHLLLLTPWYVMPILAANRLGAAGGSYFYAAWSMGLTVVAISNSLGWSLFAEGSHDAGRLRSYTRQAVLVALSLSVLALAASYLLGEHLLLLFGNDYTASHNLLTIVVLASFPAALANTYLNVLRITKQIWRLTALSSVLAAVSLSVGWLLLGKLGLEGGGWGLVAGYGAAALASAALAVRAPAAWTRRLLVDAKAPQLGEAGQEWPRSLSRKGATAVSRPNSREG